MPLPKVNFESRETILQSFDRIADKFSTDIQLKINEAYYRIVDFEFYAFADKLQDPHTYQNELQLKNNKLYLHASGIDITCGDGRNHCGILLRSIVRLYDKSGPEQGFMKEQFNGPQICATELFSNLNALDSYEGNEISLIDIEGNNQDSSFYPGRKVIKTTRKGLAAKSNDKNDYFKNLQLRYIIILKSFPKFKQKTAGIDSILGEKVISGQMSEEEARKILGYNKKF